MLEITDAALWRLTSLAGLPNIPHISLLVAGVLGLAAIHFASGKKKKGPPTHQAKQTAKNVYRNVNEFDGLKNVPQPGYDTLDKLFSRSIETYPDRPCFGTREVLKVEFEEQADGRKFRKETRGEYKWETFKQVDARVQKVGSGLTETGMVPGSRIALFADTCASWQLCAQACFRYSFPVATAYSSLGDEAIVHSFVETEVTHVITQGPLVKKVTALVDQGKLPAVKCVVYFDEVPEADKDAVDKATIQVVSLAKVEKLGETANHKPQRPTADDLAVIMYTSGSTGLPKGVMISHANLVASVSGLSPRIPDFNPEDVYIGYLPLAHVLELMAENLLLSGGAAIGYSSPGTLADTSVMIKAKTKGDVGVLRPTIMAAVPAVMERIRKGVFAKVRNSSFIARTLFNYAYASKMAAIKAGYTTPFWDALVFNKIRGALGGRVKMVVSGGAPLNGDTQLFMNIVFCCPVGQGYGLTETCGGGTVTLPEDPSTGRVGPPVGCAEIKLVNWEEGGYTTDDKPHPRGEVAIGGKHVTLGYFKNEEKTKKEFKDEDGQRWFYTGDIGEIHEDGCLKIIDRKKDLVKLQHGEYVSLGKVEAALKGCEFVENICVYANPDHTFPVAIVVAQEGPVMKLAESLGVSGPLADVVKNDKVNASVLETLAKVSKEKNLQKFEVPKRLHMVPDVWTPQSGLVTDAMKIKRNNVYKEFRATIDEMYKQ
eukprot:m.63565 g.63565  ORF g.63565 m.63565 type:complete len:712 (-) comp19472_c0_seq1:101-2236(-)